MPENILDVSSPSTIPLAVRGATPVAPRNPLEIAGQLQGLQHATMENQLFKLQMAARAEAGEVMANAGSTEEGIAGLLGNPNTAAYVPELIATMQGIRASEVAVEGEQQNQSITGLSAAFRAAAGAMNDPTLFAPLFDAQLETLSPAARAAAERARPNLLKALTFNLPSDPEKAADLFQQRYMAMLLGSNFPLADIYGMTGALPPQIAVLPGPEGEQMPTLVGGPPAGPNAMMPNADGGEPGNVLSVGPTIEESGLLEGNSARAKEISTDMASDVSVIPGTLKRIDLMVEALSKFQAGGFAATRTQLGKFVQGLKNAGMTGIPQDLIDNVANGDLAATQQFAANLKTFATQALKEAAQGTGRVMKSEVDAFLTMIDEETDPEAILSVLNLAKLRLQQGYAKAQAWPGFRQAIKSGDPEVAGLVLGDFDTWWAARYSEENLPEETEAGQSLTPSALDEVRGGVKALPPSGKRSLEEIWGM